MDPQAVIAEFKDGDEVGWDVEFAFLRSEHKERLAEIRFTAWHEGIREPIQLGNDGRVWEGHHRLCVAIDLGLGSVPVVRL